MRTSTPGDVREAAQQIRAIGAEYAKDAAELDKAWRSGTDASYLAGPSKPTLLEVLHPVVRRAVPVDGASQRSAKALDVYADAAEKIKKALKKLNTDAEEFASRMKRLEAHGEKWDQYPSNVAENQQLLAAVGKQEAAFTEAENECMNSIFAAYGGDAMGPPLGASGRDGGLWRRRVYHRRAGAARPPRRRVGEQGRRRR